MEVTMVEKKKEEKQHGREEKLLKFAEGRERRVGLFIKKIDFLFFF